VDRILPSQVWSLRPAVAVVVAALVPRRVAMAVLVGLVLATVAVLMALAYRDKATMQLSPAAAAAAQEQ
jgi:hypothetical protein